MLNNYFQHSHTSRTIASSQHHPRETRPFLGQPNLYEKCYIGLAYVEFVSYITRNESIYLLTHFFYSAIFVLFPSSPYNIWKWVDQFCWLFFSTQQYSFSFLHLHIIYESESTNFADFFFLLSNIRSLSFIYI
jgi:hypothetical protein